MPEAIRQHLARNISIYVFELIYFVTTLAGNLAFLTPQGSMWPRQFIPSFNWSDFHLGVGYWSLLLLPMPIIPMVAILTRSAVRSGIAQVAVIVAEIPPITYALITGALLAYVFYALAKADALHQLIASRNAFAAVAARYDILASLGPVPQIVAMSPLVFLSMYAIARVSDEGALFWKLAAVSVGVAMTAALTLLNMKWPVVVYLLLVAACVFLVARTHPFVKVASMILAAIAVYLLVSVVILKMAPSTSPAVGRSVAASTSSSSVAKTARTAISGAPHLAVVALSRMAQEVPYYYSIFTTHGPVCGTIIDRIVRHPSPCQPSNFIYRQMFGNDGFDGTAPAAVNIYGYALGGWAGAIIETVLAGAVLGVFGALWGPAQSSSIIMACYVMGAYAAYFFTQLPVEAAIVYPHGVLWWALLVAFLAAASLPMTLRRGKSA